MTSSQRGLRWGALLVLVALSGVLAHARTPTHHSESWARERFASAERMREALNGRPPAERARHDYQRVINAYRTIYYGAPASAKADPSVLAVAETLVEMGRHFEDNKILNEAIAQYKFLRREYPGSKYRCDALFTIGEIYKDDLNDTEQARGIFEEFLHRYPRNRLTEDARRETIELDREADREKKAAGQRQNNAGKIAEKNKGADNPAGKDGDSGIGSKAGSKTELKSELKSEPKSEPKSELKTAAAGESPEPHSGRPARVTGIRHWSTPDYTRVAIDLESKIKFGSQRIAHPDRIFFDLRGTQLASILVGKTFDVDDGFLKKIRVAQFQPGRARVVLEVDDLSDYEAFLLPNPYRLIIDIHGKNNRKNMHAKLLEDSAAMADVEAPPKAGADENGAAAEELTPEEALKEAEAKVKEDLRADAGKAPVTSEDIGDETKITPKGSDAGSRPGSSASATHAAAKDRSTTPAVKKVVVEADDDDDTPAPPRHVRGKSSASSRMASSRARNNDLDMREAKPTASGERSLIRALGLKIGKIVIDPGHGGHDTGTVGPDGLREKDLVLEVGRRLGKLLETRLGAEVVYTRKNDTFIPLETRTAIANQQRADLFISIHANSSHDSDARGVETYYLNFTSSPEALEVAARENAVSEKSIYELQDLVKKIALKEKIEESREFAGDVQESLHSGLAVKSPAIRDRGVKKAPFIVLIGANMPSILAEISFVSNPTDEHRLETSEYRQRIAESLYRGIAKYVDGLSGVKVASKLDKAAGQ
ncbi:MAG TPA: N-acetylmuramoyl-L-alanine amidase [Candidatus Acidoferrum sp.]|nr:N-acetylmuramoyl-L-alanine amidase [Candidatus Acidoferrum sp.]